MAPASKRRQLTAACLILLCMGTPALTAEGMTQLPACPDRPNCVSSQSADAAHAIEPISYRDTPEAALARLRSILADLPRTTIKKEQAGYLHAEVRSRVFRFVDDVEFLLDADHRLIHVRSASRTGYSDLGVNRRRVERIRRAFTGTP